MERMKKVYNIDPVAKPRMTRRDKWAKRPAVMKYFAFKDKIKQIGLNLPENGFRATFVIALPKGTPKRDRPKLIGKRHLKRPDIDNLLKALQDSVFSEDSHVWNVHAVKVWGEKGQIIIENLN
jgi:Holliday junction resolvase RusA-like endonuclease